MKHCICGIVILHLLSCSNLKSPNKNETKDTDFFGAKIANYEARFSRTKPIVAVVGVNSNTELTDFVVPFGILKESDVADTYAVSTEAGPIQMFPAFQIDPNFTIDQFEKKYPDGADYVFVPALHEIENQTLIRWIIGQSQKGSTIIGVCDGVWVVANAGLLKGKNAVGHWYSIANLKDKFKDTTWIPNQRYMPDDKIITTTGVTASIPISLAIVESIAGKKKAEAVAHTFGVFDWGAFHESEPFHLNYDHITTAAKNLISFWSYENIGIEAKDGIDEVSLALTADVYARTYKSDVYLISDQSITTKHGLTLIPTKGKNQKNKMDRMVSGIESQNAIQNLDQALRQIQGFYGLPTANFVALQIEYLKFLKP